MKYLVTGTSGIMDRKEKEINRFKDKSDEAAKIRFRRDYCSRYPLQNLILYRISFFGRRIFITYHDK